MAEKLTIMKLKVNLQCKKCTEKVKKVLCKFPQIQDQAYLVEQNIVVIKVVCCSPEKIRDKICCKGGCAIKTIEIVEPPKPKPPEPEKKEPKKPQEPEKKEPGKPQTPEKNETENPKEEKKKEEKPPETKSPPGPAPVPIGSCCMECYEGRPGGPCFRGCGGPPEIKPPPGPVRVPIGVCCMECYEGRPGGPCFRGYGGPPEIKPPPGPVPVPIGVCCTECYEGRPGGPCFRGYGGYYGRPVYDSYGGPRPYYVSRCDQYFSEENASGCSIM